MTYDFHGGWEATSNHNAALYKDPNDPTADTKFYVDGAIDIYTNEGVPADKLVLGVPFTGVDGKVAEKKITDNTNLVNRSDGKLASKGTWDDYSTGDTGVYDYGDLAANYVNKMVLFAIGTMQRKYLIYIMRLQEPLLAMMTANL